MAVFTRKLREHTASCFCSSSFPPSKGTLAFFAIASTEYTTASHGFALAVTTHVTFGTYALNTRSLLCQLTGCNHLHCTGRARLLWPSQAVHTVSTPAVQVDVAKMVHILALLTLVQPIRPQQCSSLPLPGLSLPLPSSRRLPQSLAPHPA